MSKIEAAAPRFLERCCRSLVHRRLAALRGGRLTVIDGAGRRCFGDPGQDLEATITITSPRCYRRIALGGGLGAAESLLNGDWQCDDLTTLVRILARDDAMADGLDGGLARLGQLAARFGHWLRQNTRTGSKRNIRAHYDLGNDFFALFLDPTMTYSCGIFASPATTLQEASLAKLDRVCRKLELGPDDHLLEIGGGWGSLATYAARHFGCRVTTTTISDEQYDHARQAILRGGLADRITLLREDYRDLTGRFDKLASIEMIEAVGPQYYETFFRKCRALLKPDGLALVQSIVIADERYQTHLRSVDFIRRYVFPGGGLPSVSALTQAAAAGAGWRVLQLEEIGLHYAETLRRWRERFRARRAEIRALGFDERFIRLWDFYLCYCEAGFEERQIHNAQLLFGGRACRFGAVQRRAVDQLLPMPLAWPAFACAGKQLAVRMAEEATA